MADTSLGAGAPIGLPAAMEIGKRKSVAPSGRLLSTSVSPSNGSVFSPSQTVSFEIQLRRGQYYAPSMLALKYTIAIWASSGTAINNAYTDNYATCIFESLQTYVNSVNCESIQRYNDAIQSFLDLQMTTAQKSGLSISFGCDVNGLRSGAVLSPQTVDPTTQANASIYTFVVPVPSAFGAWATTYYDGSDISNIRMDFQLIQDTELPRDYTAGATNQLYWEVRNCELLLHIVELSSPQIVDSFKSGPVYYYARSIKTSSQFLPATTSGNITLPLNCRGLSSAVGVFSRFRYASTAGNVPNAAVTSAVYRGASTCPNVATMNYQFGGMNYPQRPISVIGQSEIGMGHSFARTVMMLNNWNSPLAGCAIGGYQVVNTVLTPKNPTIALATLGAAGTNAGNITASSGFLYGENLELWHDSDNGILDGVSTMAQNAYLQMTVAAGSGAAGTIGGTNALDITADSFVIHDLVLVAQGGTVQLLL